MAMKSYAFLFWAYNVIWIALAAYVLYLLARLRRVDRRLGGVESALKQAPGRAQESSRS
jgi:CcmD family protein